MKADDELRGKLSEIQWMGYASDGCDILIACPACGGVQPDDARHACYRRTLDEHGVGHRGDCWLAMIVDATA